jgi:hypothetical protein
MCVIINGKFYTRPYNEIQFQQLAYKILAASIEGSIKKK